MRVLFTGASSFTGYWFVKEMASKGHDVVAVFRQNLGDYSSTRKLRVRKLMDLCSPVFSCEFGSEKFIQLIRSQSHWDLFCHHAADVTNYKSLNFDFMSALDNNTKNLLEVLENLQDRECSKILLTGTVFEQDEGRGSDLGAVYPYALSKGLTYQVFRYYAEKLGMVLGKFIIANPFGPFEELRFTSYLIRSWFNGQVPRVATPDYIRDNIHVDLLAKAYLSFGEKLSENSTFGPSGYVESQGAFAKRFSEEISSRLQISCSFKIEEQKEFPEPLMRVNTDRLKADEYGWDEKEAWDHLAEFYSKQTLEILRS